jgi:hypothetical protein
VIRWGEKKERKRKLEMSMECPWNVLNIPVYKCVYTMHLSIVDKRKCIRGLQFKTYQQVKGVDWR